MLTRPITHVTEPLYFWYSGQTRSCTGPASATCHGALTGTSLRRNGTVIGHVVTAAHRHVVQEPASQYASRAV